MAIPKIPGLTDAETAQLFTKLQTYNRTKASYKEAGCYLVVLPYEGHSKYSLWMYTPLLERRSILFISELDEDIYTSLRIVTSELWYARRCVLLVDYHEKRMSTHGDDLISFGKYRGHYLYEILRIDPAYINWIACKFTARIPKEERLVKMAQAYTQFYLDRLLKRRYQAQRQSRFLGKKGDKVQHLTLRVQQIRLEDDPYRTRILGGKEVFFVKQKLTAVDHEGNFVHLSVAPQYPSYTSGQLSALERAYRPGDILNIASARIAGTYERDGICYTRLNYIRFQEETTGEAQSAPGE